MENKKIFEKILNLVSNETYAGVSNKEILSDVRYKEVSEARALVAYIIRRKGYSYPEIGRFLNKDHATIMYSCKRVENDKLLLNKAESTLKRVGEDVIVDVSRQIKNNGKWEKIFRTYEAKCQVCGMEDIVEVHHIIPKRNGGSDSAENLLILCPNHHTMLHYGMIKINQIKDKSLVKN